MLFFKRLENAMRSIYAERKQETDEDNIALLDEKLELMKEISEYIKKGTWLGKKSAVERLQYCLKHTVPESAAHFGCTTECINSSMVNYSRKIEKIIGNNIIEMINKGQIEEARLQFYLGADEISFKRLFLDDVLDFMPSAKYSDIDIMTCGGELKFLRACSTSYIKALLTKVDGDKLAYLRYIIETDDSDTTQERLAIFNYLNDSEINITELKKELLDIQKDKKKE